ncbi:MAG: hypothetical protein HY079_13860, partial [Elusimicrobia bacterium]|nr:hypothetical protein [Elusimicrobiota bacterium]
AALKKAAADPKTYRRPNSVRLWEHEAEVSASADASGATTLAVRATLEKPATRRWRTGVAAYYRLNWKGRDTAVLLLGRTYGGLGRLAAAAAGAAAEGPPLLGVARGGTFGSAASDARGRAAADALEKAGLRWSAVSASEIENWGELQRYRAERPDGIRYLSANLVYSTEPARGPLPPYAVVEASGTRVALVGLTPDWAGRLLARAGLEGLTVADPVLAVEALIPRLRAEADVVVVLSPLPPAETARLAGAARGLDLILADDATFLVFSPPTETVITQEDRPLFANALPPMRAYAPALNLYEVDRRSDGDRADWTVKGSAVLLDDSVNPAEGFPEPALEAYASGRSTEAPVLPAAREVFPPTERPLPVYSARDFWTLAAGLLAERGRAEAGLLPATPLQTGTIGAVRESLVRDWLGSPDAAVVSSVPGGRLKALAAEAADQKRREDAGLPVDAKLRFAVSGFDPLGLLRGAPLDAGGVYRVATSRTAADALGLPEPYELVAGTPTVAASVLGELREHAPGATTADWRAWMEGRPLSEPGLWRVNFRDVGLNVRQTKVQSSDAFAAVPNSRVQGFDELLIGGVFKTDAEYLRRAYKWSNTLEMEYAKDRISPRNGPATTNLSSNRIMFLTLGTKRTGGLPYAWLARSWGPSLGLQYDGEFQAAPGLRRKQVYSAFPGLEFFDGSVVKTLTTSGIVKRDLSRDPPNTQTGLRLRALASTRVGPAGAKLDAELWNNYFFLTRRDSDSDLRLEGDANAKLSIPIRSHLSLAPFVDFYWFGLKTRPVYGYSLMTGVSLSFSRLWKPQYESF